MQQQDHKHSLGMQKRMHATYMKRHEESKATYSSFVSEVLKPVMHLESHMHADAHAVLKAAGSISS